MAPSKKDATAVDPRSLMTDRDKYIPRSFHAPSTLAAFATYIAQKEGTGATESVRKALKLCGKNRDYDPAIDPTMAKAIELTREALAK